MRAEEPFLVRHADLIFALKTFAASMLALVIALGDGPAAALLGDGDRLHHLAAAGRRDQLEGLLPRDGHAGRRDHDGGAGAEPGQRARTAVPRDRALGRALPLSVAARRHAAQLCLHAGRIHRRADRLSRRSPSPARIFDTAVARVEEISLGIICASLVSTLVFPRSVAPAVGDRSRAGCRMRAASARSCCCATAPTRRAAAQRLALATDIVEIDTLVHPSRL